MPELIDLQFEGDPDEIRRAVRSCYQEAPVAFRQYSLHDPGAYPEPPMSGRLTWRVTRPWAEPPDDEREPLERARAMVNRLRERARKRRAGWPSGGRWLSASGKTARRVPQWRHG